MPKTSNDINSALKNSSYLLLVHIANQILPFLMIPYLTRVLGITSFGVSAYVLGLMTIASVVTDYGFNLSVTPKIAKCAPRKNHINLLLGAVLSAKLFLFLVVSAVVLIYAIFTKTYAGYKLVFVLMLLPLFGQTFQPLWFFQGIEKVQQFSLCVLISRLLYVLLVFVTVNNPSDICWLVFSTGVSQILAMILGFILMFNLGYWPKVPAIKNIFKVWFQSTEFFWSRAATSTYTAGGAVFLGLLGNLSQLAYYSVAEQIYKAGQSLLTPISQVLYPMMVRTKNFNVLFQFIRYLIFVYLFICLFLFLFGLKLIPVFFGSGFIESYDVLIIFSIILIFYVPSVLIGYPLLGALGKAKFANRSVFVAGVLQIFTLIVMYFTGKTLAKDVAIAILFVELSVLVLRVFWARKYYLKWLINQSTKYKKE
jgi:PST family polysaccharide transporter